MSVLSQFGGGMPATKAIVNRVSTSGWTMDRADLTITPSNCKTSLSGAMTAATLKTILSISGKGAVDILGAWNADATGRTMRAKITIDGVVVLDSTSASISSASNGGAFIGGGFYGLGYTPCLLEPVYFNASFLFELASSLTETDKFISAYRYKTF